MAAFGPGMRLIVDRNGFGWTLQKRRAKAGLWFRIATYLRSRDNLAALALSNMHSRYVAEHGITLASIEEALSVLPDRFTDFPSIDALVINTPAPRRTVATSYKTENDYKFDQVFRGRDGL